MIHDLFIFFAYAGIVLFLIGIPTYFLSGLHKHITATNRHKDTKEKHKHMSIQQFIHIGWLRKYFYHINEVKHIQDRHNTTKQGIKTTKDFTKKFHFLRLAFLSSFSILIFLTMSVLSSLILNPQIAIHIVNDCTPLFVIALSIMALSGLLLLFIAYQSRVIFRLKNQLSNLKELRQQEKSNDNPNS